jgi:hypothetical protein
MSSTQETDMRVLGAYPQTLNAQGASFGNTTSYLIPRENFGTRALFQFGGAGATQLASSDAIGLYMGRRLGSNNTIWKNGIQVATLNIGSNSWGTNELFFGANNNSGVAGDIPSSVIGFAFLAKSLSDSEMLDLSNIINSFATTIGRNTY